MKNAQIVSTSLIAIGLAVAVSDAARAQSPEASLYSRSHGSINYPYRARRCSVPTTAQELPTGQAAVIGSLGQYNLMTSQAWIHREAARAKYLDNRLEAARTWFKMRELNRKYRRSSRHRLTREDADAVQEHYWAIKEIKRIKAEWAAKVARHAAPKRLMPSQLDPIIGKIYWPEILQWPNYTTMCQNLEKLFSERTLAAGGIGSNNYHEIQQATHAMRSELRKHIRELDSAEYMVAYQFVQSLGYEARFPANSQTVAIR